MEAVQDMADEIGVHPSDHPIVDIDDLQEVVVVGILRHRCSGEPDTSNNRRQKGLQVLPLSEQSPADLA